MDVAGARWRKSSFSNSDGDSTTCVEVAFLPDGAVAVRDTKDRSLAPHRYTAAAWHALMAGIRAGDFHS